MLYLTYDNTKHTDGFGSQLQRILSIFCLAKEYECKYIHSGFQSIDYQGLKCLEENKLENAFTERANDLFRLPSEERVSEFSRVETIDYITFDILHYWKKEAEQKDILLRILYAHRFLDTLPSLFSHVPTFSWISEEKNTPLQIAVHIRRGELFLVDSERMLPNEYYYTMMKNLEDICESLQIPYQFTIYTEQPTKIAAISPEHPGMCNRFAAAKILSPTQTDLEMFRTISNTHFKINTDPFETFIEMVDADILVCSLSSFSYTAALLKKKKGHVLIPKRKFWHGSVSEWIDTEKTEDFMRLLRALDDK